jgi:trigger factor
MRVSTEALENRQARLTIEVAPEETENSLDKAYRRLSKKVIIPGFRKGKAPRPIMELHLGKDALLDEALEDLIPETYNKAVKEQGLEAIGQPEIEIVERQPVKYKATVSLRPIIDLGDYRYVRLEPEKAEVTQEEVDRVMEQLRQQHAPWEPVGGPVSFNDLVTMDVKGTAANEVIVDRKGIQYQVIEGIRRPVAGFAEKLGGMAKGETREFSLPFPEDYRDKKMVGKEVSYRVTVIEVKRKALPEINDDFAKSLGENFDSLDSLRQRVTQQLQKIAEDEAKRRFEEKGLDTVVGFAKVQYPQVMLEHELEHLLEDQARQSGQQGLENYLKNLNKTKEQLKEELKPVATDRLVRSLVLGKIAEEEKIAVEPQEVEAEIEKLAQTAGERADDLRRGLSTADARHSVEQRLLGKKTLERLALIAAGQIKKESLAPAEASQVETEKSGEVGQ